MLLHSTCDPIWVTNPRTGDQLNVAPLFEAIEQFDGYSRSPDNLIQAVGLAIQVINLTVHDPERIQPQTVANVNFDLYRLQEMFARLSVPPQQQAA